MKKDIHPKVNTETLVTCACGNTFVTMSTLDSITVDICSACHPFYTGTQKFVDTEGRIDKFKKRSEISKQKQAEGSNKKNKSKKKTEVKSAVSTQKTPTLKEMLEAAKNG